MFVFSLNTTKLYEHMHKIVFVFKSPLSMHFMRKNMYLEENQKYNFGLTFD